MLWDKLKQERDEAEILFLKRDIGGEGGSSVAVRKKGIAFQTGTATLRKLGCVCLLGSRSFREAGVAGAG